MVHGCDTAAGEASVEARWRWELLAPEGVIHPPTHRLHPLLMTEQTVASYSYSIPLPRARRLWQTSHPQPQSRFHIVFLSYAVTRLQWPLQPP